MKKYMILTAFFLGFQFFSSASDENSDYTIVFLIESFDGKEVQEIHYPVGTTFYVKQLRKVGETIKTNRKAIYSGDTDLTIYPSYAKGNSTIMSIENKRLTVFYYTQTEDSEIIQAKSSTVIPSVTERASVTIFPNPASDFMNIEVKKGSLQNVFLINSNGQIIQTIELANESQSIQLMIKELKAGVYFAKINLTDGTSETKRVLIE